tara:strand:- start:39 stop:1376 length:1338 start_codon:yes stop_codon:yes gene_type:complete
MNRLIKCLLFCLALSPVTLLAQNSLNTSLLFHWQDTTLVGSTAYDNVYNEIWGVYQDGREYAIIGSTDGTHIFDVSDVLNAQQVAYVPGAYQGTGVIHRDFHDYKGYLYIVCDEGPSTLQIVDISTLPDSVSIVYDSDDLFTLAHNIFIDTTSARMYTSNGTIYSLEDPEQPAFIYATGDLSSHDMYVRNDTAYVNWGGSGLNIIDFNNIEVGVPNSHEIIGQLDVYPFQGYNHSGWLTEDGRFYVMADENHGHHMKMLDVSDLNNITVVSTFFSGEDSIQCVPHNQIINDQYVYTAYYHDGLRVHDVSDPYNPSLIAFYDTFEPNHYNSLMGAWGVYPFLPSGNILVSDMQTGLYVFGIDYPKTNQIIEVTKLVYMYPNPTKDVFHMQFIREGLLKIFDLSGKLLKTKEVIGGEVLILSELPRGLYIAQLEFENEVYHQKIVKQ